MRHAIRLSGLFSNLRSRTVISMLIAAFAAFLLAPPASAQTYHIVHRFNKTDGRDPEGTLLRDNQGNLYGITVAGGLYDQGTVFKLDQKGLTTLYSFGAGTDGCLPRAGLIRDPAGNLYGTTTEDCFNTPLGTIFKVDATGAYSLLYTFKGPMYGDGERPAEGEKLLRDKQGNLYGTTQMGGDASTVCLGYGCGVIFKLDIHGSETILHAFNGTDGYSPSGGLISDAQGNLYGTTFGGGLYGAGTIFRLSNTVITVLHNFAGAPYGANPVGNLLLDSSGNLLGATETGGAYGFGTVYELDAGGIMTLLYSFTGGADGYTPTGGLVKDSAGNLYGTTVYGGTAGKGNVFEISTDGTETVLHSFSGGSSDGEGPQNEELILDTKGNLYGVTSSGGKARNGYGVIFRLTP